MTRTAMNWFRLFNSYPGLYATQAFLHSMVAGAVTEIALRAWNVKAPSARQRIFLIVIATPVVSFPLYQLVNADRGSVSFRMTALLDSGRWLNIAVPGGFPLGAAFFLLLAVTSLVFALQELIPILGHFISSRKPDLPGLAAAEHPAVREALSRIPGKSPPILVFDEEEIVIFSTAGRNASVYLSSGMLEALTDEQLKAALAHEIAHVVRSRRPLLPAVFLLRAVMFFNPIVLVEFRRAVQEDEAICDEVAVSLTGNSPALADTLRTLYLEPDSPDARGREKIANAVEELERYSHRLNIESRIRRLEKGPAPAPDGEWFVLALTLAAVAVLNYFIV